MGLFQTQTQSRAPDIFRWKVDHIENTILPMKTGGLVFGEVST